MTVGQPRVPTRRRFLLGMGGILASGIAPAVITTPGLLMPVKTLWTPPRDFLFRISNDQGLTWMDGSGAAFLFTIAMFA